MSLRERIFDCLPAGTCALPALLQLVDIVETDVVPTAAVECNAQPRLLINPGFVATYAATPEKLTMLVLHELHHVLLGHTRRFGRSSTEDNLVFDVVINALLCRMFPDARSTALFRDFYSADTFPACLLRPTDDWTPGGEWRLPAVFRRGAALRRAGEVYRSLYSGAGATYHEIRSVLPQALRESGVDLASVTLLGGHDDEGTGAGATEVSPEFIQIARQLIARWPKPPDPIKGQSLVSLLDARRVKVAPPATDRERLRRLICSVARSGAVHVRDGKAGWHGISVDSPVPVASRRSTVLRALGQVPLLYQHALQHRRPRSEIEPVHVYLDVSGSIGTLQGALYGAVRNCQGLVHREVHLFSTEVRSIDWKALLRGDCHTTGGTDIGCVEQHMVANRVRHAVLVTDGWVGQPGPALQAVRLGVAYTQSHGRAALDPLSAASTVLSV